MNARGKVGIVHILIVAGLLAGGFWAYNYGPVYLDNSEVKQLASETWNRAHNEDWTDDRLVELMLEKINGGGSAHGIGSHVAVDRFGVASVQPGLGLTKENVKIIRDNVRHWVTVTVDYDRTITQWPLKKQKTLSFHILKEGPQK